MFVAFFVVLMIFAIISNDDSSDQSRPSTDAPPATEAPTEGGSPPVEFAVMDQVRIDQNGPRS
jgi:hypothetical protein